MAREETGKSLIADGIRESEKGRGGHLVLAGLYHLLRLALAGIFIYAGFTKLMNPKAFAHALAQFGLIPDGLLPIVALGLPGAEVLAGVGLIFELRFSLAAILIMLTAFLVVLGYAIFKDLDIDCGCFTVDELAERTTVKAAFLRDLLLMAAIGFLFWWQRFRTKAGWPGSSKD